MNNRVQYQQFDITIRTNLDGTHTRFDVVWQIQNTENGRNLVNSRFTCKEFDSEKAAYEFGLREARAWIDEHALLVKDTTMRSLAADVRPSDANFQAVRHPAFDLNS